MASARALGRAGAVVHIVATSARIFERAAELAAEGIAATGHIADLTESTAVAALADAVGPVDILVNNAGMASLGTLDETGPLETFSDALWRTVIDRNLTTTFNVIRAIVPGMKARGYGRIVNVSSTTGAVAGVANDSAYAAAKAGMLGLSRSLCLEVAGLGITVNCVAPGWIANWLADAGRSGGGGGDAGRPLGAAGRGRRLHRLAGLRGRVLHHRSARRRRRRQFHRGGSPMSGTERVVLVTGAAGGIGAATARRFAATGWRVVLTDRDAARLAEIAAALGDAPFRVADLADAEAARALPDWAAETAGRLDAVVNAAGIWLEGPAEAATASEFDALFAINVRAVCLISGAAVPHLKRTEGVIVNLSSDAGVQGNSGAALYCASKGAVSLYTKALALELAPFGVRVNAVCPGDVDTPMMAYQARRYGGGDEAGYIARILAGYPQGPERARLIRAEEVAAFIRYLAEPDAAPITGALLSIDFGYSAGK